MWGLRHKSSRGGAIDGFPNQIQPLTNAWQYFPGLFGNLSVGFWPDVEQHIAILTDIIDQIVDEGAYGFILGLAQITPTPTIVDDWVRDPVVVDQCLETAKFQGDTYWRGPGGVETASRHE